MATRDDVTQADTTGVGLERRAVGLPTAIATTFGLIVASTVLYTVVSGFALSYTWLVALGIALVAMYLQSMSFAELATMIPRAGSMNEYVRAAFGAFFGTLTVLMGYIAIQLFPGTAESYIPGVVIHDILGADFFSVDVWIVLVVATVAVVNVLGVRPYGAVEVMLTVAVAASAAIIGLIGLFGLGTNDPIGSALPDIGGLSWGGEAGLAGLLGLAIFAFVGMEYTCPLAEELENPSRDIPLGIFLGLGLVAVPMILLGLAAARYVPAEELGAFAPTAHIDVATAILGGTGKWWMAFVSIAATLSTLNALIAGIPRILYGMGLTGQLPRFFSYLLPATRAPVVGIALVALIPIVMNLLVEPTSATFLSLILAGVLGWATAYILIHMAQMALRVRAPELPRPFRSPLFPVPQLVGMGLLALAAYKLFPVPEIKEDAYRYYLYFLATAVGASLLYNLIAYRSLAALFRPIPVEEVRREAELVAADVPPPSEGGAVRHDRP
ncbi:MAG: APC family permease [Actinomycetota bacterium]|nr:APC family permease [Actinomycetota bacterium]